MLPLHVRHGGLRRQFDALRRILDEHLHLAYPELCSRYGQASETLSGRIESVSERFVTSYSEVIRNSSGNSESPIPESAIGRINDACRYFAAELLPFTTLVGETPSKTDNKSITRRLAERRAELDDAIRIKLRLMQTFNDTRFSTSAYLEAKAKASLEPIRKTAVKAGSTEAVPSTDIPNPALYNRLTAWRAAKAAEIGRPAFFVASTRSLLEIARSLPSTTAALGRIPGIGKAKLKAYGQEILEMVAEHSQEAVRSMSESGAIR